MVFERLDPKVHDQLEILDHYARYSFAAQFVAGKRVLDVACGTGYGSHLLKSLGAREVVGVDRSAEAVAHATAHYSCPGVSYLCGDAEWVSDRLTGPFDVIISFETLEHLETPDALLRQCKALAHEDTLFVFSVPNEGHLKENLNRFHLHRFDRQSFENLLAPHFPERTLLPQYFTVGSVVHRSGPETVSGLTMTPATMTRTKGEAKVPDSFVAVCRLKPDAVSIVDGMVSGWHFYTDWVKVLADERPGLIEIGNQRQEQLLALKATAETADRWIQQLEKVHAWLREIVEQERKKNDQITQQLESQRQRNYQLTQQVENQRLLNVQLVSQIRRWQNVEQSRGYRVLAFFQNRVMPPDTRRGRILRPGVNLAFHMLRPVYRGARMVGRLLRPTAA